MKRLLPRLRKTGDCCWDPVNRLCGIGLGRQQKGLLRQDSPGLHIKQNGAHLDATMVFRLQAGGFRIED